MHNLGRKESLFLTHDDMMMNLHSAVYVCWHVNAMTRISGRTGRETTHSQLLTHPCHHFCIYLSVLFNIQHSSDFHNRTFRLSSTTYSFTPPYPPLLHLFLMTIPPSLPFPSTHIPTHKLPPLPNPIRATPIPSPPSSSSMHIPIPTLILILPHPYPHPHPSPIPIITPIPIPSIPPPSPSHPHPHLIPPSSSFIPI